MTFGIDFIIAMRGGLPEKCDFCGQPYDDKRTPIPEEAGAWTCSRCWEEEELYMNRMAFVLHSGGLDSSTALMMARKEGQATAVSINYGQRHSKEIEYATRFTGVLNIKHEIHRMAPPPPSMLTDPTIDVPDISYADIKGMSPTYVPFRNGQLLSRIAGIAQGWVMEDGDNREATVWFGAHAEDAQNWAYPDCTPEFIGAMAAAIYVGTYHKVRLIAPFAHINKSDIVRLGASLGTPYQHTWSCYKGEQLHCGVCPTCRSRKDAFTLAGVDDPTEYAQ